MTVVLDSNVLLVAVGKRSAYRGIWQAFVEGKYQIMLSEAMIFEYIEILQQRAATGAWDFVMDIFMESPGIIYQQVYYSWNLIYNDPDANKFVDAAIAANAEYIVTDDAHFNLLKSLKFPRVKIITAREFLVLLGTT